MNQILIDWTEYLESIRDRSSNTIKSYLSDVTEFLQYMSYRLGCANGISIDEIPQIDISNINEKFLNKIGVREIISYVSFTDIHLGNSPSTSSRKLSSIRNFYNYIHVVINIVDDNPVALIDGPKIGTRIPKYLELEDIKILLETVLENKDEFYKFRDYAILITFLNTGLRISELINLTIDDLDNETINIIGKGNKERIIYLNASTVEAIGRYLEFRPESDLKNLFLNKKGDNFLGPRGIQYMLNKYLKKSGLSTRYTPHSLRHTAATLMYQHGGVDIRTLQVLLGHESISTTEIYTHVDKEQIKTALNNNPIDKLIMDENKK